MSLTNRPRRQSPSSASYRRAGAGPWRAGIRPQSSGTGFRNTFLVVVMLVAAALIYLWGNVRTVSQRTTMAQLRKERTALLRAREKLMADVAGFKQSSLLRTQAESLGLVFPSEPPSNLYLSDSTTE